ncbi:ABC transporter ATP-binding protein [Clostridium uliginosum]|nr:ABC transporter ATP-binding protein [Clostridium uliginosum]
MLDFAGNYKYLTYIGCILSGISAVLVLIPFICIWKMAYEIIQVFPNISMVSDLSFYGWEAVIFSVVGIFVYFGALMCTHISAFRTARNMKNESLHYIVKLPIGYFEENGSGKIRRIINECSVQTETFLAHILPDITGAVVTPVAMIVLLMLFDWRLGIISLIPIVISIYFANKMMGKDLVESMKQYQNALDDMNNEAVEYVRGIPVVKTFGQTVFSFENFHDSIEHYKKWAVNYTIKLRIPMCNFTVSINSIFALLIPAGVLLIASAINPNKFISDFIFYIIFTPILTVVMNKIMFSSENFLLAKDATKRINSILSEEILKVAVKNKVPNNATIKFEHVDFSYKGSNNKALDNVSLEIKEGCKVALVGPSGGGKTTVASMIPRFYDVNSGKVTIGGVDIREISNEKLMSMISFVFQNTKLFKTSLFENIRFSKPDASREEVLAAAKAAQCEEIFEKFPDGINSIVGSKGIYLSGGEAQRISLARAILKNAPIILLDEATAFADPENEYKIQKAFEQLIKGKTVLMIAHRLSTIKDADEILVIDKGKIIEKGSHHELLNKKGIYNNMWLDYQTSICWKVKEVG